MNLSAIVEVAIGIVFIWITMSLATIQIQEWIGQLANKRAKELEATIHSMLANNSAIKAEFYDHPVIRGLTSKAGKPPSYIPSQQFALALFDMAMNAGTEASAIIPSLEEVRKDLEQAANIPDKDKLKQELDVLVNLARSAASTNLGKSIANASYASAVDKLEKLSKEYGKNFPQINDIVDEAKSRKAELDVILTDFAAHKGPDPALVQLRRGIAVLSAASPELNRTLQALIRNVEDFAIQGETQLGVARKNVEKWFDDSMDRLNGAFKRYAQFWAFIIGLYLALFLNIDSINLAIYLWRDPTVRQVLVANASKLQLPEENLAKDPEQAMQDIRGQFVGLNLPIGWVIAESKEAETAYWDGKCQLFPGTDQTFGIPLALPVFHLDKFCIAPPQSNNQMNMGLKFFGILFTAVAAAQGAPFWFDLLKKLINLRGTGVNPVEKGSGK